MEELLSEERRRLRFTRFRARARNPQEMARTVAYGAEQEQLRKTKLRGKAKGQLKQALYQKKRVVFFWICPVWAWAAKAVPAQETCPGSGVAVPRRTGGRI